MTSLPNELTLEGTPAARPRQARGATARLLGAVCFIICVVAQPPGAWHPLGALALLGLFTWALLGAPRLGLLRKLALALPFVSVAAFSLPFLSKEGAVVAQLPFGLVVHSGAVVVVGTLFAKAGLALAALALLAATTSEGELLAAAQSLAVPKVLVSTLALTLRYLEVLQSEALRMLRARDARGAIPGLKRRIRVTGQLVGSLFVRSYQRAQRLGYAMTARGFDGRLHLMEAAPLTWSDFAWLLFFAVATFCAGVMIR